MLTRRQFTVTNATTTGSSGLQACSSSSESYDEAAQRIWRVGDVAALPPNQLQRELVRLATLAPSSHNTQCWRAIAERQCTRGEYDGKPRPPKISPCGQPSVAGLARLRAQTAAIAAAAGGGRVGVTPRHEAAAAAIDDRRRRPVDRLALSQRRDAGP